MNFLVIIADVTTKAADQNRINAIKSPQKKIRAMASLMTGVGDAQDQGEGKRLVDSFTLIHPAVSCPVRVSE
jgi:hypothetical protein